jgi:Cellulase (glycosyl hydrolase family 5)/IPT/TIG domain
MRKLASIALAAAVAGSFALNAGTPAQAASPSLHLSGNQLLDGNNVPVQFHGVNRSGTEYACIQGWGIFDGPSDLASVQAMAAWHINSVRIPLNEDCWLGINGSPAAYSGSNYTNAIVAYVNLLHANGIYAELSLIWGAPSTYQATYQPGAPDEDHSPAFWSSLAATFKNDPNVILAPWGETIVNANCFLNGGVCEATYGTIGPYNTAGMQHAVNVMRGAGFNGPIAIPCITYANDCTQWLSHKPTDTLNPPQLIAEAHIYGNNACGAQNNGACLNSQLNPVAAVVPMILGETGETYDASDCGSANMQVILPWADAHNVSYQAWTWNTWGNCSALIADYAGTPYGAYGQWVQSYYAQLATSTAPAVISVTPSNGPAAGGTAVTIGGRQFTGATGVKFGGTVAAGFKVNSDSQITATSPPGTETVDVTVTTAGGTSASGSGDRFTYTVAGQYRPLVPARILDTRSGIGGIGTLRAQQPVDVAVAGQGGVPAMGSATPPSAVVLNVTVTNPSQTGYVTIYPTGSPRPATSSLNFVAGQTVPNLVEVALGTGGKVSAYLATGSSDVIFDVAGWVTTPGTVTDGAGLYRPIVPSRVLDTRTASPVGQTPYRLQIAGTPGIPPMGASGSPAAVVLNLTVTDSSQPSYVTVYPSDASRPTTSNQNLLPGLTRANRVVVKLGADGAVGLFNAAGTTDLIVDVNGWFTDATSPSSTVGQFTGLYPARLLDTRAGSGPLGPGATLTLQVSGHGGVPAMSDPGPPSAVVLNVTATDPTTAGYLAIYPSQPSPPGTSDLNWIGPNKTVPNLVVVKLSSAGQIAIFNPAGRTDVVVDVFGWYQ